MVFCEAKVLLPRAQGACLPAGRASAAGVEERPVPSDSKALGDTNLREEILVSETYLRGEPTLEKIGLGGYTKSHAEANCSPRGAGWLGHWEG